MNISPAQIVRMILMSKFAAPTNIEMLQLMTSEPKDEKAMHLLGKAALAGEALSHTINHLREVDEEQMLLIALLGSIAGMVHANKNLPFHIKDSPSVADSIAEIINKDFGKTSITRDNVFSYGDLVIASFKEEKNKDMTGLMIAAAKKELQKIDQKAA